MAAVTPDRIRNVAVVGHGGAGKTTLVESLLHATGATTRLGKVDDGTSILDTDPEEHKRRISINLAVASFQLDGVKLNLLDTPGFADFAGDQRAALRVADAAIVFVDGSAGVQVGTQLVWNELDKAKTPRIVVVGRLDRENADFDRVLAQLREAYGIRVVPLHVPVGHQQSISGTIDLLHGTVLKGPKDEPAPTPDSEKDRVGKYRQQLVEASDETARKVDPGEKLSAFVFKTLSDPFVGKLSFVRVYSGTLHHNAQIFDAAKGESERVGQVFFVRGKEQEQTDAVGPGDICAIPKLTATSTNATLTDKDAPIKFDPIDFPSPSFSVAIEPQSKVDLDKLGTALHKLTDEDPSLHVRRDDATHETILSGIGESAIDTAVHHLKEKFGVQVLTRTPRVPYKESIRRKTHAQGRYKRQTGGHGMFGDCWLEIEPLVPGSGVEFATRIVGGSVPRNFWPAVEKGVREAAEKGVIAGYPLSDFRATLYDGSYHQVDSNEMSFRVAGSLALQNCVKEADAYLLEPIHELEVLVPEEQMGDVLADLNGRRGRVLGMESTGAVYQQIKSHVPLAELFRYATELRSMTGGRGTFTSRFLSYEECPSHIAQKVIAAHEEQGEAVAAH